MHILVVFANVKTDPDNMRAAYMEIDYVFVKSKQQNFFLFTAANITGCIHIRFKIYFYCQ